MVKDKNALNPQDDDFIKGIFKKILEILRFVDI